MPLAFKALGPKGLRWHSALVFRYAMAVPRMKKPPGRRRKRGRIWQNAGRDSIMDRPDSSGRGRKGAVYIRRLAAPPERGWGWCGKQRLFMRCAFCGSPRWWYTYWLQKRVDRPAAPRTVNVSW